MSMKPNAKTVLLVDDEPHIRYVVQLKLAQAGLAVITACNGDQAYEIACREMPDLIVTDFQMPACDGVTLCRMLADNRATSAIPAIMLTARGHRVPKNEISRTNIRQLLAKPFSPRELLSKVTELLRTQSPARANPDSGATAA